MLIDAQLTSEIALQKGDFRYNIPDDSPINIDAQRTPEVALQNGDFRYNLRDDKQKRRIARCDTNRTVWVVTDTADTKIAFHQKT